MQAQRTEADQIHIDWAEKKLKIDPKGLRFLDLGCGQGGFAEYLAARDAKSVVAVDIAQPIVFRDTRIQFNNWDLDKGGWGDSFSEGIDVVFAFDILEHLESPYQFLKDIHKILVLGGLVVLTTPNVVSVERMLRPMTWSGAADPQHKILFSIYSLSFLLERCGFNLKLAEAPVRKIEKLCGWSPKLGGQILAVALKI